ncbi:MAG: hypothetical protein RL634_1988, partial [Bacteroidota bacterium]
LIASYSCLGDAYKNKIPFPEKTVVREKTTKIYENQTNM